MPVSVSDKLLALRHLYFVNLDIEVHRAALTVNQLKEFALPSTPIKRTNIEAINGARAGATNKPKSTLSPRSSLPSLTKSPG